MLKESYGVSPGSSSTASEINKKVVNLSIVSKPPSTLIADYQNELHTFNMGADTKFAKDYYGQVGGGGRLTGETEINSVGYRSMAQGERLESLPGPSNCVGTELGDSGQKTNVVLSSDRTNINAKP